MRLTIAYSKIKKRNLVLINNDTHQRETVSERPIRPPLIWFIQKSSFTFQFPPPSLTSTILFWHGAQILVFISCLWYAGHNLLVAIFIAKTDIEENCIAWYSFVWKKCIALCQNCVVNCYAIPTNICPGIMIKRITMMLTYLWHPCVIWIYCRTEQDFN